MSTETPATSVVAYEPSLGRLARTGSLKELAKGTFRSAAEHATAGRFEAAAALVEVSVEEADELRDIYERWPIATLDWIRSQGVPVPVVEEALASLDAVLDVPGAGTIQIEWPTYLEAVADAVAACRDQNADAAALVEIARAVWQGIHDRAVDRMTGVIDIAVRTVGEDQLGALWDALMNDWYDAHIRRYALTSQPWADSARHLIIAILDGFHAHLTGTARQGDIEVIEEPHRTGFRFAPCGSGGRSLDSRITAGAPRAGAPYGFAVTTREHDWAWNTVGICTYCVHCCQLNERMPIDQLGYPTRVIDAPIWTPESPTTSCTWWVYHDPSDVPDEVYRRVGRDSTRRPARQGGESV